jgi:hypothetical protein
LCEKKINTKTDSRQLRVLGKRNNGSYVLTRARLKKKKDSQLKRCASINSTTAERPKKKTNKNQQQLKTTTTTKNIIPSTWHVKCCTQFPTSEI